MALNYKRSRRRKPKILDLNLDKFGGGVNKQLEESRIKNDEAVEAINLMLVQDGVWRPRWGTQYYTPAIAGATDVDGFSEYIKSDGTKELIICADDGTIYKSIDGGAPSALSGATLTGGNKCYFVQSGSYLYITNGVDSLTRYNGSTLSQYTERLAPAWAGTPLARGAGLSTGNYTYYYQVTSLNDVGETTGNTEQSITVDKERTTWTAADETITLDWDAATGATRYQVYVSDESGYEVLLGSTTDTTFVDDNSLTPNPYIEVPDDNTTGAPKFTDMCLSNNRIWATGNPDAKYRVYFTGTGQFQTYFSDYYGGGWIDLEKGGREEPIKVVHYQDGQGTGKVTAICKTPEGTGSVWQITVSSVSVENETFSVPSATKIVGSVGSNAPYSVVLAQNDIWMANTRGINTLGPEKNYYGILRTNELSAKIRDYWRSLIGSAIEDVCAYYYDAKVFFSVTTTGSENNRIIYYDRERIAWVVDWTLGAKQFGEYTDSSDNSHFLFSEPGSSRLVEFDENFQGDNGVAFNTSYLSPRIPMGKKWTQFAKIKKAYIRLGSPEGTINFEVVGTKKNEGTQTLASKEISPLFSLTGVGWDQVGSCLVGDTNGIPTSFADSSDLRFVNVNKKIRDIQFKVSSSTATTDYQLLGLIAEGFFINTAPPSSWKLN